MLFIHKNKSFAHIEQFYYSLNSLSGETSIIIKSLVTSSLNYEIAWTILKIDITINGR